MNAQKDNSLNAKFVHSLRAKERKSLTPKKQQKQRRIFALASAQAVAKVKDGYKPEVPIEQDTGDDLAWADAAA